MVPAAWVTARPSNPPIRAAHAPQAAAASSGAFKIGTTRTGLPTDDDLAATIRHGMLPAAMPPWPQLTDADVKSVVIAVRHLAIQRTSPQSSSEILHAPAKRFRTLTPSFDPGPLIVLHPGGSRSTSIAGGYSTPPTAPPATTPTAAAS